MFDKSIKELIFFELPNDRIKYIAKELEYPFSCSIKKFLQELIDSGVDIKPRFGFLKALHAFEPLYLNLETGAWNKVDISFLTVENNSVNLMSSQNINKSLKKYLMDEKKSNNSNLESLISKVRNTKDKIVNYTKDNNGNNK